MMISPWQAIYAFGLVLLFGLRGPSLVAWVLLADFVAIMAIMGAMDLGLLTRAPGHDQPTGAVLVVWCLTAAIFVTQPGVAKVLACISALGIAAFAATLLFGVQASTTSAIVNALAFVQLAVAGFGTGDGGGSYRGRADQPLSVAVSAGSVGMGAGGYARGADLLSQDRGAR
jgi:hypothetical protein